MSDHAAIVREYIEQPCDDPTVRDEEAIAALERLEAEVARLREALVFYRDSPAVDIACDQGHVASAALAPKAGA